MLQLIYFVLSALIGLTAAVAVWYYKRGATLKSQFSLALGIAVATWAVFALVWILGLENFLARRLGGTLKVDLPPGVEFVNATWKEDSLWVTYFERGGHRCVFKEFSRYGIMEGDVVINGCNPVGSNISIRSTGQGD